MSELRRRELIDFLPDVLTAYVDTGEIHGRINSVPKVVGSPAGAGRLGWRQRE